MRPLALVAELGRARKHGNIFISMRNSRGRLPSTPDPLLAGGMQAASASMQALEAMDKVSFGEGLPGEMRNAARAPETISVLQHDNCN